MGLCTSSKYNTKSSPEEDEATRTEPVTSLAAATAALSTEDASAAVVTSAMLMSHTQQEVHEVKLEPTAAPPPPTAEDNAYNNYVELFVTKGSTQHHVDESQLYHGAAALLDNNNKSLLAAEDAAAATTSTYDGDAELAFGYNVYDILQSSSSSSKTISSTDKEETPSTPKKATAARATTTADASIPPLRVWLQRQTKKSNQEVGDNVTAQVEAEEEKELRALLEDAPDKIDHNEEYQRAFEMACTTPHDERQRAALLQHLMDRFLKYAELGARAIVLQSGLPQTTTTTTATPTPTPDSKLLVPPDRGAGGSAGGEKFTAMGIRFKYARDWEGIYGKDDDKAQKAARLEIKAMTAVIRSGIRTVHTVLTALINIRGHVIYATAMAPLEQLLVGSCDAGSLSSHVADGTSHPLQRDLTYHLAHSLHVKPHPVWEGSSHSAKEIAIAMDVEFHLGCEGRLYMVDLARVLPPTPPRVGRDFLYHHFRPEALQIAKQRGAPPLNADAFSRFIPRGSPPRLLEDERHVSQTYQQIVLMQQVPRVAQELDAKPVTGVQLAQLFHELGVNMRLRCVVAHCCRNDSARRILLSEHAIRSLKTEIRRVWREACRSNVQARQLAWRVGRLWHEKEEALLTSLESLAAGLHPSLRKEYVEAVRSPTLDVIARLWGALGIDVAATAVVDAVKDVSKLPLPHALVKAVEVPVFTPLEQLEEHLRQELGLRPQKSPLRIPVLADLLRLFREWSNDRPQQTRDKGRDIVSQLLELLPENELSQAEVYREVALFYIALRDASAAMDALKKELELEQKVLGLEHVQISGTLSRMAQALRIEEKYTEALELVDKALHLLPVGHAEVASGQAQKAELLERLGRFPEAERLLQQAVQDLVAARNGDELHPDVCTVLIPLVDVLQKQGKYVEARTVLERVQGIELHAYGEQHHTVALTYRRFGSLLDEEGKYAEALEQFHKCLDIQRRVFGGVDNSVVAITLNDIGLAHQGLGHQDEAQRYLEQNLHIVEQELGPSDSLITALINVAIIHRQKEQYDRALTLLERAQEITVEVLGEEHYAMGFVLNNKAQVYRMLQQYDEAEQCLLQALELRKRIYGDKHVHVGKVVSSLSGIRKEQGRMEEAVELAREALTIIKTALGPTHPDVADMYSNLAIMCDAAGSKHVEESLACRLAGLEIERVIKRASHQELATLLNCIAYDHTALKQYDEAVARYKEALEERVQALHEQQEQEQKQEETKHVAPSEAQALPQEQAIQTQLQQAVALDHYNLGMAYRLVSNWTEAMKQFQKALQLYQTSVGVEHERYRATQDMLFKNHRSLTRQYTQAEQGEEAVQHALAAVELGVALHGEQSMDVALVLTELSNAYCLLGQYTDALAALERGLSIKTALKGEESPEAAVQLWNMAALCQGMGQLDQALALLRQNLKINQALHGANDKECTDTEVELADVLMQLSKAHMGSDGDGDADTALQEAEEALKLVQKALPPDNAQLVMYLTHAGQMLTAHERHDEALPLHAQALELNIVHHGAESAETSVSHWNVAAAYEAVGDLSQAQQHFEANLSINKQLYGPEHQECKDAETALCRVLVNYSKALFSEENVEEAVAVAQQAIRYIKQAVGPVHPDCVAPLVHLGQLYVATGNGPEAIAAQEEALRICQAAAAAAASEDEQSEVLALCHWNVAAAYEAAGEKEHALQHYEANLHINQTVYGPHHQECKDAEDAIARVRQNM